MTNIELYMMISPLVYFCLITFFVHRLEDITPKVLMTLLILSILPAVNILALICIIAAYMDDLELNDKVLIKKYTKNSPPKESKENQQILELKTALSIAKESGDYLPNEKRTIIKSLE